MNIYNLKEHLEYLDEVCKLEYDEWACNPNIDRENRLKIKRSKILKLFDDKSFCKLILVNNDNILIGFISIFPHDSKEEPNLTPWYATMYVKPEFRGHGYSKLLNDAILKESKKRGFKNIYLKTTLNNYYEKFGAKYIKDINSHEKLYIFIL